MTEPQKIVIDIASAMEKMTPEMMQAMDKAMAPVLLTRVQQAIKALRDIKRAVEEDEEALVYMPDDVAENVRVEKYIDSVLKELLPGEMQA